MKPRTNVSEANIFKRCFGLLSVASLIVQSVLQPVYGQVVADPNAPKRERPTVLNAGNGIPLVNIGTPTAAGVSKNSYSKFNVNRRGVVLNNSRKNVQSKLGGWVQGNPWLARGEARIILNQVNSNHPSHLNGYVEIAGRPAEFILANPSGIQINGGGFINANRVILSTGKVQLNGQGGIEQHHINDGKISIVGKGLNTPTADYTGLLAQAVQVNAGIWAKNLSIVTGKNRIIYSAGQNGTKDIIPKGSANTPMPNTPYALDVGKLGGMYAGKIHLIGTEAGLGVRNAGIIGASAGNIHISADGQLINSGTISSNATNHNVDINTHGHRIHNSGTLSSQRDINIANNTHIRNKGTIHANRTLRSKTQTLNNSQGSISAGRLDLQTDKLNNTRGNITQTGSQALDISTSKLSNTTLNGKKAILGALSVSSSSPSTSKPSAGNTTTNTKVSTPSTAAGGSNTVVQTTPAVSNQPLAAGRIQAVQHIDNTGGHILGNGQTDLTVSQHIRNSGEIRVRRLNSNGKLDNRQGKLDTQAAQLRLDQLDNRQGRIHSSHQLDIQAQAIANRSGRITSADKLSLSAQQGIDNQRGTIAGIGKTDIRAGHTLQNQRGTLASTGANLYVGAQTLNNTGGRVQAKQQLSLHAALHNNRATDGTIAYVTAGDIQLHSPHQPLSNRGGVIAAQRNLNIHSGAIHNQGGTLQAETGTLHINSSQQAIDNIQQGNIRAKQALHIQSGDIHNATGYIGSQTELNIQARNINNNGAGALASQGTLQLQAQQGINNRGGRIVSIGNSNLQASAIDNEQGRIKSNAELNLTAHNINNQHTKAPGLGIEGQQVQLNTQQLNNTSGAIRAAHNLNLNSRGHINNTSGLLSAQHTLQLGSANQSAGNRSLTVSNTGGTIVANQALITHAKQIGLDGKLVSQNDLSLNIDGNHTVQKTGQISAKRNLNINLTGVLSNYGQIRAGNKLHAQANAIHNQAGGVITAEHIHLKASGTLSNRGVINAGKQTLLEADQVHNIGTGQIYGDHIAIAARYLLNDAETVQGNKKSAVVAARKRLDLGVHTLVNREGAELISGGDMAIGGSLDNKQQATGSANSIQNRSARIEVHGDLNIKAHTLQNLNDHFKTKLVQSTTKKKVGLLHNGKFYSEELVGNTFEGGKLTAGSGVRDRILLPSDKYPFSKFPADITKPGAWASSKFSQTWELGKNESNPLIVSPVSHYMKGNEGKESTTEPIVSEYNPYHKIWQVFNITPPSIYSKPTNKQAYKELYKKIRAYNKSVRPRTLRDWTILNAQTTEYKPVVDRDSTKPAQILVGGNLNTEISGRAVNDKSQIIVGKQVNIGGKDFKNVEAQFAGKVVTKGTITRSYLYGGGMFGRSRRAHDTSPYHTEEITTHTLAVSDYKVNQVPQFGGSGPLAKDQGNLNTTSGQSVGVSNTTVTVQASGVQAQIDPAHAATVIRSTEPNIKLPTSSLFSTIPSAGASYLIETNPNFANYRQWLSSDYMLKALSYDPARMHKRLGDGYYEQRLIQEQIAALTGRQFLGGHGNQDAQYKALMNAGITFAKAHNIRPGIALTPAQTQALSSDIVWLVNKEITLADGSRQTVLAPKVYVRSRKGDLDGTGTLISARDINLNLSGTLANTGTIAGRNIVSLRAKDINLGTDSVVRGKAVVAQAQQDLNLLGGSIQAQNHLNVGAGRDLNISSTTSTASDQGKTGASKYSHERLDRVAGLYVSKPAGILIASAGRDLNLTAAAINSRGAAALGAGRNLNLNTLNTHEKLEAVFDAHNHYKHNTSQDIGSHIQTAGNLHLQAGQDINATAANINSQQGALTAYAGRDIHLKTGRQTDSLDVATRTTSRGFFSKKTTTTRTQKHNDYAVGNELGGKTVQLQAGRDATIEGSNVIGDTGTVIQTGRDIHITAGKNTHNNSHYHHVKKSGLMGSGGFGFFIGTKKTTTTADGAQTSHSASTVGSLRGDTTLVAGNHYKQTASNVLAPKGDITVLAKNIDVEAGHNTSRLHQTHKYEQKGLTVAVNVPVISAVQESIGTAKTIGKSKSHRMNAMAAASTGISSYFAAREVAETGKAIADNLAQGKPKEALKAANISVSITAGKQKTSSNTTQTASSTAPSAIAAGGNVTLVAHNPDSNPKQGNISVTGSRINSDKDIRLIADNHIKLQAAKETSSEHSQHKSSSSSAGIKVSVGQEIGISLIASANKGKGKGQGNGTQHTNTTLTAKNKLQLNSGKNTTLHGAVAKANSIQANVGGNLHIESPQNTDHYHAASKSTGGSVSIGISNAPFGASISKSNTKINSQYQSTQNTSGLQAGDGGFDVNVKGNTKLIGGVISSTQAAIDNKRNQFKTGSLTLQDLKNQAAYEAKGSSITTGVGSMLGASAGIAQDSKKASSTTQSGISGIAGNAAVRTGDKDSGIAPIFNKQQVQDEIQAQIAITAAFGKQASKAWGKYASGRQKKAQADLKQAQASQDPEAIAKAKKAANCWSSTGVCRAAGHAAIGGLTTGSAQGAVGGGLASITAPRINQALAKANVKGPAAQALTTILTAAVGSAAGTAGAVAATNEVGNNYLWHAEAVRLEKLKHDQVLGRCDSQCKKEINDLEALDARRDRELKSCIGVNSADCANKIQAVRSAAAEYIRKNQNPILLGTLGLEYSAHRDETLGLAGDTIEDKGWATVDAAIGEAKAVAKGLYGAVKQVATAISGDKQAQEEIKQSFKHAPKAMYKYFSNPDNLLALLGAMTPEEREALAQAYENGDNKGIARAFVQKVQNMPVLGGGAGTIKRVGGAVAKGTSAAKKVANASVKGSKVVDIFSQAKKRIKLTGVSAKRVDQVINETLSGKKNFKSKFTLSADEALYAGQKYLGTGYKEIGKPGSGVFHSADGKREFRIDSGSLSGAHNPGIPHVHFGIKDPNTGKYISNNHVPYKD